MGYAKVVKVSDREVRFVHQLGGDGKPYAEDVTLTAPEGVDAASVLYYARLDGKIGVVSYTFHPVSDEIEGLKFPEPAG